MTKREIIKLIKKYRKSDHESFDIYAPSKEEREKLFPILLNIADTEKVFFKEWTYDSKKVKGFKIIL